ncbi:MAG: hypothetical protein OXN96_19250 [Bryobacterales bacterium]|nr:hypothetical protein [Bryobacterales bacterium]
MPDSVETEFRFEPVATFDPGRSLWTVICEGVDWAHLELHRREGEWRLRGFGPLQGLEAAWGHNGQRLRSVPAWMRREVIATLALSALARFKSSHETLARIREHLGASRAVAREEETGRAA